MDKSIRNKLFVMMILELFIWGAWLPLIWDYMGAAVADGGCGFTASQQAWIGSAFAIASILAIFFSNQFADRKFAAEKFLSFSHLVGGLAMLGLFFVKDFNAFFALMLIHSIFYVPTISVANSLAFANIKNPAQDFGFIRMGGTVGWILAAWPLYFILQGRTGADLTSASKYIFIVSAVASFALAVYARTLPHTPPKKADGENSFAWLTSGKRLMIPFVLVLFVVTFIDATIHNGYFLVTGNFLENRVGIAKEWIMPVMSLGQVAEILTMLVLGKVLAKLGWRTTMLLGIAGHALRYLVFAYVPESQSLIIAIQLIHGICYAFFFATVYIFIDAVFPPDVRTSAQGWFNLLILGLGDLAAKWTFFPYMASLTTKSTGADGKEVATVDWQSLFLYPSALAIVGLVLLAFFFKPPTFGPQGSTGGSAPAH
jgi:MFS family permease